MPASVWFQNGEAVEDGRGNRGRAYRFFNEIDGAYYFRIRVTSGPIRDAKAAGDVWVSASGWKGLVDYQGGTEPQRCCQCGRNFLSPIPLAPGEEFCKVCSGGDELAVSIRDFAGRLKAWRAANRKIAAELQRKGA